MIFSKYKSVHVNIQFKTFHWLTVIPEEKQDSLTWPTRPLTWYSFISVLHCACHALPIPTRSAAFILWCVFFLLQGFSAHSHSGKCCSRLASFSLKPGLNIVYSEWPFLSPIHFFPQPLYPIQCFFDTHTICNYVYLIYCLCPPLVPWEEGPCSSYFPVYFMVLSKNGHSKFWMNG